MSQCLFTCTLLEGRKEVEGGKKEPVGAKLAFPKTKI